MVSNINIHQSCPTINFVIAGFPKCGSSSLHQYLDDHPQIQMSLIKEPGIFKCNGLEKWNKQINLVFPACHSENMILGESTVGYILNPQYLNNMIEYNPELKLIILLRDPVKRTISHYWHRVKTSEIKDSLEALVKNEPSHEIFEYSRYKKHIDNLFDIFKDEQVLIVKLENLDKSLNDIIRFIGASPRSDDRISIQNSSKIYRNSTINIFIKYIRSIDFQFLPPSVYYTFRKYWHKIKKLNLKDYDYPETEDETKKQIELMLAEDIHFFDSLKSAYD